MKNNIQQILEHIYPIKEHNVIIADGRFPKDKYLHSLISSANTIIACDGAFNRLNRNNIKPDYIIGDCDSISKKHIKQFGNKIIINPDQNSNDLTKAVNLACTMQLDNIVIFGSTGLREDHTIANIALLVNYAVLVKDIAIISDYGIFTISRGVGRIPTVKGQQISLFSINPNNKISCNELKWSLLNFNFNSWYNGTLNQATGDYINISCSEPIIIYRAFCIKK